MNIKPLSDRVVVKAQDAEEKTASGIIFNSLIQKISKESISMLKKSRFSGITKFSLLMGHIYSMWQVVILKKKVL